MHKIFESAGHILTTGSASEMAPRIAAASKFRLGQKRFAPRDEEEIVKGGGVEDRFDSVCVKAFIVASTGVALGSDAIGCSLKRKPEKRNGGSTAPQVLKLSFICKEFRSGVFF